MDNQHREIKGYRELNADEIALMRQIDAAGPVPMTVSADLEGSRMSLPFGTEVPNPLGLAAVDDVEATSAISTLMAEEARAAIVARIKTIGSESGS